MGTILSGTGGWWCCCGCWIFVEDWCRDYTEDVATVSNQASWLPPDQWEVRSGEWLPIIGEDGCCYALEGTGEGFMLTRMHMPREGYSVDLAIAFGAIGDNYAIYVTWKDGSNYRKFSYLRVDANTVTLSLISAADGVETVLKECTTHIVMDAGSFTLSTCISPKGWFGYYAGNTIIADGTAEPVDGKAGFSHTTGHLTYYGPGGELCGFAWRVRAQIEGDPDCPICGLCDCKDTPESPIRKIGRRLLLTVVAQPDGQHNCPTVDGTTIELVADCEADCTPTEWRGSYADPAECWIIPPEDRMAQLKLTCHGPLTEDATNWELEIIWPSLNGRILFLAVMCQYEGAEGIKQANYSIEGSTCSPFMLLYDIDIWAYGGIPPIPYDCLPESGCLPCYSTQDLPRHMHYQLVITEVSEE